MKRKWGAALLALALACWPARTAGESARETVAEPFVGETLKYEMGFWIFFPIGGGWATFNRTEPGKYLLTHEGKAQGLAGLLTFYRREIHRSYMTATRDGRRLVPLRFEEDSIIGGWFRKRTATFDYARQKVIVELKKSGEESREEIDIPDGVVYDDPVTAFYNFRAGVYGKVEPGRDILVRTVPRKKGENILRLSVLAKETADKRRAAEEEKAGKDLLVRIQMDREMLSSKKGELEIWFDRNLVPVSGVVKDVRFFGDIRGKRTFPGSAGAKAD